VNRLAAETSPYLRQHADNPVDWYPWGDEAFTAARRRDRPVFLSVGYSSCHWCHVMAHESFEDATTAAELNAGFVAVKVDREERPDIDAVYMEAVQATTGGGGWPMSVFLTPDGRPFFGGTYFPVADRAGMPSFRRVLAAVDDAWRGRRDEVERQADELADAVERRITLPRDGAVTAAPEAATTGRLVHQTVDDLKANFDDVWGGFGGAPKFPQPSLLELCLQHHRLSGDAASLAMVSTTLGAMAVGGIYDHLGGGFSRYSTDRMWTVPHFEKMLYDQAGLVRAYLHAYQVTADPRWRQVVEETVGYVLRDMAAPEGGLYSAEDADSEGEEGRFYLWTPDSLTEVLGAELARIAGAWYGVEPEGNFEGRSILRRPLGAPLARPADVETARARLFEARADRVRPGLDDKVLTEWNAMFGSALAEAAAALGRQDWVERAEGLAEFLWRELRRPGDGRLLRSWQGGSARHLAFAGDHAWLVDCLTRVGELTGRAVWTERAVETAGAMLRLFGNDDGPLFTSGTDAESLVVRPMDVFDGATPSANSAAATALLRLGALTGDDTFSDAGASLAGLLVSAAARHPLAVANALSASALADGGTTEVVVTGPRPDLVDRFRARYEPTAVLAWGEPRSSPVWEGRDDGRGYVCRHFTCRAPASTADELDERLDGELAADRRRFAAVRA
jgi:uncharacterized protein YyaL (SSP411 family)